MNNYNRLKIFFTIVVMLFITISFTNCSKTDNSVETDKNLELNKATEIGKEHNKSLDFVFKNIKKKKQEKTSLSKDDLFELTKQSIVEYVSVSTGIDANNINDVYTEYGLIKSNFLGVNKSGFSEWELPDNIEDENYELFLKEIQTLVENDTLIEYEKFDEKLMDIENRASSYDFYPNILAISSVSRNSYKYWYDNFEEWKELFGVEKEGLVVAQVDPRFWRIMKSDTYGAISGALAGAGFLGWGAVPGAYVFACGFSGIEGIYIALESATSK